MTFARDPNQKRVATVAMAAMADVVAAIVTITTVAVAVAAVVTTTTVGVAVAAIVATATVAVAIAAIVTTTTVAGAIAAIVTTTTTMTVAVAPVVTTTKKPPGRPLGLHWDALESLRGSLGTPSEAFWATVDGLRNPWATHGPPMGRP